MLGNAPRVRKNFRYHARRGTRLSELGYVPIGDRPEEFAAHIKSEIAALAKVVKELRLSAD